MSLEKTCAPRETLSLKTASPKAKPVKFTGSSPTTSPQLLTAKQTKSGSLSLAASPAATKSRSSSCGASSKISYKPHPCVSQLITAVEDDDEEMVFKLLHAKKVYANTCNKHNESALHIAAGYGYLEIVKILCNFRATLDITDKQGDSPLYWAARHGHLEVVEYLSSKGADVNIKDKVGETALHVCARYDQPEVLAHLCRVGAEVDVVDKEGDTPLLCGTWHGYQSVVEGLVQSGSSLGCANKDSEMPLHVAAVRGYCSLVKFFCENGADINAQDKLGCTPLQLAVRRSHLDVVEYLCQQGCKLNIQNVNGDTVLHDACRDGDFCIFKTLQKEECDFSITNKNKATPLHLAAKYGHSELVRLICIAGCDLNAVNDNGYTAGHMAAISCHQDLADLLHHLSEEEVFDRYSTELLPNQIDISRVKLLVCGAAGVGKTELIKSLKCPFLRSLFRRRSDSNLSHMLQQRTHGISVQQETIPSAGSFSIWDFSGVKNYYLLHEEFLRVTNSVILLVVKACEPVEDQVTQLRFWLSLIKAKRLHSERVWFAGGYETKPNVAIVSSFASVPDEIDSEQHDRRTSLSPSAASHHHDCFIDPTEKEQVLETVRKEFSNYFTFSERIFQLDCRLSQSNEIKALRQHLGAVRCQVIQSQPKLPIVVLLLAKIMDFWREEHEELPVLTWMAFLEKSRKFVNPLLSEELAVDAVSALHDMGEVIFIKEGRLSNIVVLDPMWLGRRIFGPALSPPNSIIQRLKSVTGYADLPAIQRVYPELETLSVTSLFEHFELCIPVDEGRFNFLFPCLITVEPVYGLWEKDASLTVYAGIRVSSQEGSIFTPSLFPRIQIQARRVFSHDIEDQELTFWRGGLKCCRGEVQVLMRYPETYKSIEILVRGTEETRFECYQLVQRFYKIVVDTVRRINPGTAFMTEVLSPRRLKEHKPVLAYSPMEVFAAERGDGVLTHAEMPDAKENILNAICCGCKELLVMTKSAVHVSISDIPLQTKHELSRLLDPPHPMGRDWCLLALQLHFTEEVPRIDRVKEVERNYSPTDRLLTEWNNSVQSTAVVVVDALRAIGREDAANTLIKGLSPFSNPSHTVVINIPGIPPTTYLC